MESRMESIILASIVTLDPQSPSAEAVLISHGKIRHVGLLEDCRAIAPKAETQDLRGMYLTPGLTDAHIHLTGYGFALERLDLSQAHTLEAGLALVSERSRSVPTGTWIVGGGVFPNRWSSTRYPTAADLDRVSPNHPVYIRTRDGHAAWVNTLALKLAGIHAGTPEPEGGKIVRDANGNPTGMLLESSAFGLVARVVPEPTPQDCVAATRRASQQLEAWGYTAVHTMAAEPADFLRSIGELEQKGELPLRVWASIPHSELEQIQAVGLRGGMGGRVKLSGIKFFTDGALGSRTAWMIKPYLGTNDTGVVIDTPAVFLERAKMALGLGFCPVVHAIGDRANHEILNALEQLAPLARARGVRLRLEHAQHLLPEDIPRFGRLGIVVSPQPIHLVDDAVPVYALLGEARAKTTYALKSLLESGAVLALGSDAYVANPEPILGFKAAVERIGADGQVFLPEERLTPLETLRGYTHGAAMAAGWESWYGQVKQGYAADFTLWEKDPSLEVSQPIRALRV
ncbi:MAG: amidohydrolase [Deinococcales bacterium]